MKKLTMYKPLASLLVMMLLVLWQLAAVQAQAINLPITGNDAVRCGAGEVTLEVDWSDITLNENQVKWYTVPFYGEPIATGLIHETGYIEFTQTFYVDYIGDDGCSECDRLLIRAVIADQALPTQLIYPATAFCNDVDATYAPIIVGVDEGEFSVEHISGEGGNLLTVSQDGAFNPNGVSPGDYRIVYVPEALEGCTPSTATEDITITAPQVQPVISYTATVFCGSESSAAVNREEGEEGGVYSATPSGLHINSSTGEIDPSQSLEGEYTVTYFLAATGGCPSASGNTTVSINTVSEGGTATADAEEISSGSSTTIRLTDYNGSIQWQSSINNDTFTDITDANASELFTGDLTETTYFRAVVTNGICASDKSSTATVTVSAASVAGTPSVNPEVICTGSNTTLTLTGNTGNIQWQSNETGSFVDIPGAVTESYTTPILTNEGIVDETINYRAVVTEGLSAPDISATVTVTIRPNPQPGLAIGDNICSGNDGTVIVFDYLGDGVQWQSSSSEDGEFDNIHDATEDSYTAEGLASTTYYRAEISNSPCNPVYSDVVAIVVSPPSVAGTALVNISDMCVGGTATVTLAGYTGDIFWEYKAPGSDTWVYSGGSPSFSTGELTVTGTHQYRAKVTSGVCDESISNIVEINVVPQPVWTSYDAPAASITYGEDVSFSVDVEHGLGGTITWVRSTIPDGVGETVTSPDTPPAVGTYYYRPQFSTDGPFCSLDDGTEYTVEVTQKELTVINAVVTTKTYDGNTNATITGAELSGLVSGDAAGSDVSLENHTSGTFDSETAGTHSVTTAMTISGDKATNYSLTQPDLTGTIEQLQLTIDDPTITKEKVYDGSTTAAVTAGALQNVVGSDDVSIGATTATYDNANVGTGKTITVEYAITGDAADNYIAPVNFTTDDGEITEKELIINGAVADDKVYNGTTDAVVDFSDASLDSVVDGDVVNINSAGYSATFLQSDVGTDIAVTVTGVALGGTAADNYEIVQPVGLTANITVATVTITANDYEKGYGIEYVFDGTEFTATEMVGTETITSATLTSDGAAPGAATGTYTIEIKDAVAGAETSLGNYDITYADGTMTVSKIIVKATEGLERKGYNTLKAAYDAINAGTHKGDIVVTIYANTNEVETATLNASDTGSADYNSVEIKAHTGVSIEGSATPLIIIGQ